MESYSLKRNSMRFKVTSLCLIVFAFVTYYLEGLFDSLSLITSGLFFYKRTIFILLLIALLVLYKPKIRLSFLTLLLPLLATFMVSYLTNSVPAEFFILGIMSVVIYALVFFISENTINGNNLRIIVKLILFVSLLQLPIVFIQYSLYDHLPQSITSEIHFIDIGSGTFHLTGDPSMTFVLTCLVTFLLFDPKSAEITNRKWIYISICVITIFLANSKINQISCLLVLLLYALRNFQLKQLLILPIAGFILLFTVNSIFSYFEFDQDLFDRIYKIIVKIQDIAKGSSGVARFLSGKYERSAALYYFFIANDISLIGHGPGSFFSSFAKMGHFFTFYWELGLIGLTASYLVFYKTARYYAKGLKERKHYFIYFVILSLLTITTDVMRNSPIILTYILFMNTHRWK